MAEEFETILSNMDSAWMRMLDDTLMRLRLLGSLQSGNRVNTRLHYVYRNTWHARFCRSFVYTESREHTLAYARNAVDNISAIIGKIVHQKWSIPGDVHTTLDSDMEGAVVGLGNLQATYADDIASVSALTSLITRIRVLLSCLRGAQPPQPLRIQPP
jgi:hypothetical protein